MAAEPIEFEVKPAPDDVRCPSWVADELKTMGWKPLEGIDFFGDMLFPREYNDAVSQFELDDAMQTGQQLYRRWAIEKSLPNSWLLLGLLYERAGRRDEAVKCMERASGDERWDPGTLADVARWELSVGLKQPARRHARAALKLWPDHPVAIEVIRALD